MYFLSEVAILASEERRNRLLAEATHSRSLQALQVDLAQTKEHAQSWWQERLGAAWRWFT